MTSQLSVSFNSKMETSYLTTHPHIMEETTTLECVQSIEAEYDNEGVFVYQAFCNEITEWAVQHQAFGGPAFNPSRMTWIKPSFAWVLYRSGYASKHNQEHVLKIKISHENFAHILAECQCKHGGGGSNGRVQWDPARDMYSAEGKEPRKMLRKRAIQIGIKGRLSEFYVGSVISIQDVTELARKVGVAHTMPSLKKRCHHDKQISGHSMEELLPRLPVESEYIPCCSTDTLRRLGMLPGEIAEAIGSIGFGKASRIK
jgi:hypothetical protein